MDLIVKKQDTTENQFYSEKWFVKNGRKKYATIYHKKPNGFSLEISGLQWNKQTLNECLEQCEELTFLMYEKVIFCKIN